MRQNTGSMNLGLYAAPMVQSTEICPIYLGKKN